MCASRNPVFIGDTLRSESKVIEKRESKSRPDAGIVVFEHRSFNQRGQEVAYCKRSALMRSARTDNDVTRGAK